MLVVACGQQAAEQDGGGGSPDRLWDRSFGSVEIREDGESVTFAGEPFSVGFEDREEAPVVRWSGGCNLAGSPAEITPQQIRIAGPVDSTTMGCPPELEESDQWMSEFFAGDPRWELTGDDRLRLESGNRTVIFEEAGEFPAGP